LGALVDLEQVEEFRDSLDVTLRGAAETGGDPQFVDNFGNLVDMMDAMSQNLQGRAVAVQLAAGHWVEVRRGLEEFLTREGNSWIETGFANELLEGLDYVEAFERAVLARSRDVLPMQVETSLGPVTVVGLSGVRGIETVTLRGEDGTERRAPLRDLPTPAWAALATGVIGDPAALEPQLRLGRLLYLTALGENDRRDSWEGLASKLPLEDQAPASRVWSRWRETLRLMPQRAPGVMRSPPTSRAPIPGAPRP